MLSFSPSQHIFSPQPTSCPLYWGGVVSRNFLHFSQQLSQIWPEREFKSRTQLWRALVAVYSAVPSCLDFKAQSPSKRSFLKPNSLWIQLTLPCLVPSFTRTCDLVLRNTTWEGACCCMKSSFRSNPCPANCELFIFSFITACHLVGVN